MIEHTEYFADGDTWIYQRDDKVINGYKFTGKFLDPETGLYDFGQRFYDPKTSLWISVDPLGTDTPGSMMGRPMVASFYAYAGLSPAHLIDPDGRDPQVPLDETPRTPLPVKSAPQTHLLDKVDKKGTRRDYYRLSSEALTMFQPYFTKEYGRQADLSKVRIYERKHIRGNLVAATKNKRTILLTTEVLKNESIEQQVDKLAHEFAHVSQYEQLGWIEVRTRTNVELVNPKRNGSVLEKKQLNEIQAVIDGFDLEDITFILGRPIRRKLSETES